MRPKFYPRGKIRDDDDGQVAMRFAIQDNTLIIAFPHPTTWIGLGPSDVDNLIKLLTEKRAEMKKTDT